MHCRLARLRLVDTFGVDVQGALPMSRLQTQPILQYGSRTGYQELPANTVVFSTLNTMTFKHYRITAGGIELK